MSMGISSTFPHHKLYQKDLVAAADKALYQAKAKGRNTYCFHSLRELRMAERAIN